MGIEEVKRILVREIENHLPYQQLNMASQVHLSNQIEKILKDYREDVFMDKVSLAERLVNNS